MILSVGRLSDREDKICGQFVKYRGSTTLFNCKRLKHESSAARWCTHLAMSNQTRERAPAHLPLVDSISVRRAPNQELSPTKQERCYPVVPSIFIRSSILTPRSPSIFGYKPSKTHPVSNAWPCHAKQSKNLAIEVCPSLISGENQCTPSITQSGSSSRSAHAFISVSPSP